MGSPMIRTRCPVCSRTKAVSTVPMIRPGLRPACAMSAVRTRAASSSVNAERSRPSPGWGTATSTGSSRSRPARTNSRHPDR